jgi:putative SOS response-associated peptidase YedK
MCGRVRLSSDVSEIKLVFSIPPQRPTPNVSASWNVAPTDPLPVVRYNAKASERSLDVLRWGLVPFWAKDIKVGFANINAKAEGIESKPAFREAFQRRRCLVPVDNFYEWVRRESRVCDCPAVPSGRTCRPIGSTLRGRADRKRAV